MGGAIRTEWGAISLAYPSVDFGYSLQLCMRPPPHGRIKQSYRVHQRIVAQAIREGAPPLFAALRNCQEAIALLAQHDGFIMSVIEAQALAEASFPDKQPSAPSRPKAF